MHPFDWICLGIVLASLVLGAWRGLLYEALSLGGWVLAYFAARWAAEPLGQALPMGDAPTVWRAAAGFVLVFIAVAFAGGMLAWAVRGAARSLGMRPVDRLLGAVFGALRGALLLRAQAECCKELAMRNVAKPVTMRDGGGGQPRNGTPGHLYSVLLAEFMARVSA